MLTIHVIGRALIVCDGHILLCRFADNTYYFLPGGQVEYNEDARSAIRRELREEFGGQIELGSFLGVIEHTFPPRGRPFHEYSLVFAGSLEGCFPPEAPASLEAGLSFFWMPLAKLPEINLKPSPLADMVAEYLRTGRTGGWASSMVGGKQGG